MNIDGPKERYSRLLTSIRRHTNVFEAFEAGATPQDIKQSIIDLLSAYFANSSQLEKYAVDLLAPDAAEYARLAGDRWTLDLFQYCLSIHQKAVQANEAHSLTTFIESMPDIYAGLSVFWSVFHLELDKSSLKIEEFLHESLRNIGALIEGAIKPTAKALLQQQRIIAGGTTNFQAISNLTLGQIVTELTMASPNLSYFSPWSVPLNQWRNIAQHFSARVEGDEIVCWYGSSRQPSTLRLRRSELLSVVQRIRDVLACLRLANRIFAVDNLPRLVELGLDFQRITIRPEMDVMNLVSGLATQGFEVIDLQVSDGRADLVLRDVSIVEPNERRLYITQYAVLLWRYTGAGIVSVEYQERDGTPSLRTSAPKELFERAEMEGRLGPEIAGEVDLIDLKTGQVIPKLPRRPASP
jgi:hypothetical protein